MADFGHLFLYIKFYWIQTHAFVGPLSLATFVLESISSFERPYMALTSTLDEKAILEKPSMRAGFLCLGTAEILVQIWQDVQQLPGL